MFRDISKHIVSIISELFRNEEALILLIVIIVGGALFFAPLDQITLFGTRSTSHAVVSFIQSTMWLWAFLILRPMVTSSWLFWRNESFKKKQKNILLEIRIPRQVKESPRAMEQVMASLHSLRNVASDLGERWKDGEVTRWFSLEMVSFGGEIHFYIRVVKKQRKLVEAALYAYYPDVELEEVDDYIETAIPVDMQEVYRQGYDFWGTEMILRRESAYPIKTYLEFESNEEGKTFDPISAFLEVLAKIKKEEIVGIQINIAAAPANWGKKWDGLLTRLSEPKTKALSDEGDGRLTISRTPGEINVLKAVEANLSKPAFHTLVRFIYLSPKPMFYDSYARRGLAGAFNQYAALDLNSIDKNHPISTRTRFWYWPHVFPKTRNELKKQRMLYNYRNREMPPETFMGRVLSSHPMNWNAHSKTFLLNIEGAATLFHLPTEVVLTGPHMKRVDSRKGGAPAGLAIFGGDEEMDKFT